MGEYVLRVQDLDEGLSERTYEIRPEWLAGQLEDVEGFAATEKMGAVELVLTRQGREVMIRGTVSTPLGVECVRCLEMFEMQIDVELEVLMLPGKAPEKGTDGVSTEDDSDDELGVERYQGETIELDGLIRDTILLEVPMNPNCGESCKGWDHLAPT